MKSVLVATEARLLAESRPITSSDGIPGTAKDFVAYCWLNQALEDAAVMFTDVVDAPLIR